MIDQVPETLQTGGNSSNYRETKRRGVSLTILKETESNGESHDSHNLLSDRCN